MNDRCPGCGLSRARFDGPTDPYGGASAACWAAFNDVTLKDYGEYRYPAVHRLIVDAYMAQHPSFATPSGRRSVAVHLVGLHLVFDRKLDGVVIARAMGQVFPGKPDIAPLVPIPPLGALTIEHVHSASNLEEHTARATEWATAVHRAWSPHRARVVAWADAALERSQLDARPRRP